jgi:hypothetical protein
MTRQPNTLHRDPAGAQAPFKNGRSISVGTLPMTRALLAQYDFYSIEFMRDGESHFGFLSHDPMGDCFDIVYSVIEQGAEKRRTFAVSDEQIKKISYDEAAEILVLR